MLCKRIIFANDNLTCAQGFLDFLYGSNINHRVYRCDDACETEADADDETLYEICCAAAEYVKELRIKHDIRSYLHKNYNCFNADEINVIVANTLARDFVSEIPGRMYVYIKLEGSIEPFGFYTFMCKDIKESAYLAVTEEAEKILAMNDNCDFIELLKSFAVVSSESYDKVELKADSSGIKIMGCFPEGERLCTEYSIDDEDVLAELVTMNPKKIEISGREEFLKNDMSTVITAVFEDRIQYK